MLDLLFICPDIQTQQDATFIHEMLDTAPSIEETEVDLHAHTVHVVVANNEGEADVRMRLSRAGFPPED